ncbi:uncharacterized protein LOC142580051 isoform X2 [Dermacentor variabilis]|uniref:uncharacterized protein LOC142580051 isoform X2 n=1 Tax=Dermacentor variabilis TaxID=34621 RepID=UPI003F5BDB2C
MTRAAPIACKEKERNERLSSRRVRVYGAKSVPSATGSDWRPFGPSPTQSSTRMAGRSGARAWWWSGPVGPPSGRQLASKLGRHQTDLGTVWAIRALMSATAAVGLATGPVTAQSWTTREPATTEEEAEEEDGAAAVVAAAAGVGVGTGHIAPAVAAPDQGRRAAAAAGLAHLRHVTAGTALVGISRKMVAAAVLALPVEAAGASHADVSPLRAVVIVLCLRQQFESGCCSNKVCCVCL